MSMIHDHNGNLHITRWQFHSGDVPPEINFVLDV